jgi:Kef-type K+ transport system membrane component KefB
VKILMVDLSCQAFPVLARIMIDQKLIHTKLGAIAISAAAVDDVVAWSLLALVISMLSAGADRLATLWIFMVLAIYAAFVLLIVKPWYGRIADYMNKRPVWRSTLFSGTAVLVFLSAFFTEALGVHVVFGGFIMGLAMPRVIFFLSFYRV